MNVLQINYTDTSGYRYNGGSLIPWLKSQGHQAIHLVGTKDSAGKSSQSLCPHLVSRLVSGLASRIEHIIGIHGILYPQSFTLPFRQAFRNADIIHYHIIHNEFFSYLALPWLTALKPSVWSLHDPWAMTGHCIHPLGCTGWKTGCQPCPHLDYRFALRSDTAYLNCKLKDFIYERSTLHLIVASRWMQDLVSQSPLLSRFQTHFVPFGLDLKMFSPGDKAEAKAKLGIPSNKVVIGFRAFNNPYKGLQYSIDALARLESKIPIHILTCHEKGGLQALYHKYTVTELGEVDDGLGMVDFFRATDIHLMPSVAESFGMMAMEAAACGVPSIVFSGTPLMEVCFAPSGGVAIEWGNLQALTEALRSLTIDTEKRKTMGGKAREFSTRYYSFDRYATQIKDIYDQVIDEFSNSHFKV